MATNRNLPAADPVNDPDLTERTVRQQGGPSDKFAGFPTRRRRRWVAWAVRRWRTVRASPDRGYNIMEAAIILPVIIFLTMLVVQFALVWHGRHIAQAAAADAARSAAAYQSTAGRGRADAADFLQAVAPHLLAGAIVTVNRGPQQASTTVHAQVLSVIPFGSFSVDEHASAPVEQFLPVSR